MALGYWDVQRAFRKRLRPNGGTFPAIDLYLFVRAGFQSIRKMLGGGAWRVFAF
jgi:hypothetical protein